ncbi:MAG: LysR family transcriptional regulator [Gammaproteobacteria bacterium]|nr:LysR family transcriptional regulator [Gammaproteobacteria bacterium]
MDTLLAMRLFLQAVQTGSFSAAGRHLDLAPSSVSRRIDALEAELGVRLLNRTTRSLSLTEAGRIYHERARRIVADLDEANREVSELDTTPRGTLRVSAPVVFGQIHLAPAVAAFTERYPEIRVEFDTEDRLVDVVEEGLDLAIRIASLRDSTLVARKLMDQERVICASPGYLARHGEPRTAAELTAHSCLVFHLPGGPDIWRPGGGTWRLEGPDGIEEVAVSGRFQANNAMSLVAAARRGLGLLLVPTWLVNEDLRAGRLRAVLRGYAVLPTTARHGVYAVYPSRRYVPAKVRAFIEFLVEHFRSVQTDLEAQGLRPA